MKIPLKKKTIPFTRMFNRLLRDPRIRLQHKGLFCLIKSFANADGSNCFPSVELLAVCSGVDIKAIYEGLHELSKAGWLSRTKQGRKNIYILNDEHVAKHLAQPASIHTEKRKRAPLRTSTGKRNTTKIHDQAAAVVQESPPNIIPIRLKA